MRGVITPEKNVRPAVTLDGRLRPGSPAQLGELKPSADARAKRHGYLLLASALLVTLLLHGVLLFNQHFVGTYDALIHIFFGSSYAESWFDPWEPRWYTGFMTVAYPPLSHQLIALLSKVTGYLLAFALVQLYALLQLTVGMFRFSKLLAGPVAAGLASLALALSSSLAETVHVFGQLPTVLSLSFLLNALPFIWAYLQKGRPSDLAKATLWTAATTAAHHVTTLFGGLFFIGPLVLILLLAAFRSPRPGEPQGAGFAQVRRRLYRVAPRLYRTFVFGLLALSMLGLVVFPYWYWSGTDPILQVPIPHGSRADFLAEPELGFIFWVIPWLSTLWFLPFTLYRGLTGWRWPVVASLLLLLLLGTGGTTPVPKLLLGPAFDILTLDRFTFWATMLTLPFVGMAVESALKGSVRVYLDTALGKRARYALLGVLLVFSGTAAIMVSTLTQYRRIQPEPIDIDPILNFIEKDGHWQWRYLTLGFGDQMAWLAANTRATTPDGNYHAARRLPELTSTPVERLEGAKYKDVPGIGSLRQFLTTPETYHLKFIFSNDSFYDPLLYFTGWHSLGRLSNGIEVWEREGFPPLPARLPRQTWPFVQQLMWGVLPLLAACLAYLSLLARRSLQPPRANPWQRRRPLAKLYRLLREDALLEQKATAMRLGPRLRPRVKRVLQHRAFAYALLILLVSACTLLPARAFYQAFVQLEDSPAATVEAYWDALDFKRFQAAYGLLEPAPGLSFDRWRLERSITGGLRSGYAKLNTVRPELIAYEGQGEPDAPQIGDRALLRAELEWFTAVDTRLEEVLHELVYAPQGWRILAEAEATVRAQTRFTGQADIDYYRAPRRLTTGETAASDLMDRPRLVVRDARLVSYQARQEDFFSGEVALRRQFSVVGVIQNVDARPADLTLTAALRDAEGRALSYANAGTVMLHKVLPGESTPFRIDFDGVNAPAEPETVTGFDLFPNAVVTSHDLERDLATWSRPVGDVLALQAVNVGTREATVPHALASLFDEEGLAWVSEAYGPEAIPPRDMREFSVPLTLPAGYERVATFDPVVNVDIFGGLELPGGEPPRFAFEHPELSAYLIQLHAYYGSGQ